MSRMITAAIRRNTPITTPSVAGTFHNLRSTSSTMPGLCPFGAATTLGRDDAVETRCGAGGRRLAADAEEVLARQPVAVCDGGALAPLGAVPVIKSMIVSRSAGEGRAQSGW